MSTKKRSYLAEALHGLIAESGVFEENTWYGVISQPDHGEKQLAEARERMRRWFDDEELPTPEELRVIVSFASRAEETVVNWLWRAEGANLERAIALRDRWKQGKYRFALEESLQKLLWAMGLTLLNDGDAVEKALLAQVTKRVPGARTLAEYAYLPAYAECLMAGIDKMSVQHLAAGAEGFDRFIREHLARAESKKIP